MQLTIPNHLAIIPDGNRRWAKSRNKPTFEGHRIGFDTAIKIGRKVRTLGINTFTLWAFSTENWKRALEEVRYLMKLYEIFIEKNLKESIKEEIRVVHLGRKDRLPKSLLKKITESEEKTKDFKKYILNVALDYGGRDEVIRAIKKVQSSTLRRRSEQEFKVQNLDEKNFNQFLDTHDQPHPNPDLIIRTSGEQRTSGLMIWQAAYAEYVFFDKHFPDLNEDDIDFAVQEYSNRQRRFGK
ncbi:MAG: hypothetical protein ACD_50C00336G0005 [uncultured bacterium]|nr:MAG: hypothetical protein ACD_50C00336G0005 [uncultured bacterium]OGH13789.1 MAG: di-trans,poly-cis-decaprenylcistransferase [Candidatus Levybacteria bacterium RIFCSPHIGHO2_01_FULL_38_26]